MNLFRNNGPKDVIFLEPVKITGEKLPKDKIRMLYCDSEGKVYATLLDKAVYKLAMDSVVKMEASNKDYATLGLEIGPGSYLPLVVEVGPGEVWALEHILDHARRSGSVPDVLKKQLKQIIKLGNPGRREATRNQDSKTAEAKTPRVLNRLPYYSERDIEFSVPIYKAQLCYPLLVLKSLEPDEDGHSREQRLLVLDNDGDMAVLKMPLKIVTKAEKRLGEWTERSDIQACILVNRGPKGFDIGFLTVSPAQKKALDTMARQFEETGNRQQPLPVAARKVLVKARDMSTSPAG